MELAEVEAAAKNGSRFAVESYPGVAFYFYGYELAPTWDRTGFALMVMVGDDRKHIIDPDEISMLRDDQYCSECGQIGCGHGVSK